MARIPTRPSAACRMKRSLSASFKAEDLTFTLTQYLLVSQGFNLLNYLEGLVGEQPFLAFTNHYIERSAHTAHTVESFEWTRTHIHSH